MSRFLPVTRGIQRVARRFLMRARRLPLSSLLLLTAHTAAAAPPHWAQWRGPDGQGIAGDPGVPLEWSPTKNVLWKTAIPGRGYSSPVVWGDRIFLTTAIEGDVVPGAKGVKHVMEGQEFAHPDGVGADRQHTFKVVALDATSGRILWEKTAWEGTPYDTRHRRGSFAAPTPVSDGTLVYAYFGAEGIYTYDFQGNLKWSWKTGGIASFGVGVGTSPVLYQGILIVQCDEDNGEKSFIVGLERKTGKEVWRTTRNVEVSWATPILVKSGGRDELVTAGSQAIIGYEPKAGRELGRGKGVAG